MKFTSTLFVIILLFGAAILPADTPLTVERLLSSPFPSSMVASNDGERVGWVFNDQGKRNIWIGQGPDFKPVQLTHYNNDDGQELTAPLFSKDGSFIIYVRGGDPNGKQEIPNPLSDPKGAKQEVWLMPAAGNTEPKLLGEGSEPNISPDGKQVVFAKDGKIMIVPVDTSKAASTVFGARGKSSDPQWSPDGSKISFVSDRGDHSYIGVYDFQKQKITWLCAGVDRDFNALWSADGKRIAFIRFPGTPEAPGSDIEPQIPFSIWIADVDSGTGKQIWESKDTTAVFGQTFYLEPPDRVFWWTGNRLVFYWEGDGWMRIYSISESGGTPTPLTPANCEAEHASISPDHTTLFFDSNCNDIDRRHIWQTPIQGGTPKQITTGKGLEWNPTALTGNKLFLISSTATRPAAPATLGSAGSVQLVTQDLLTDFPTTGLTEPQQAIFKAADGLQIHGQLFLPPASQTKTRHPAVIFMHGGPIREMLLGFHYMGYYHNTYAMNQYLASKGYVVLSVNYRSGIGYGRAFRTAPHQGPKGASEYQDILAAAKYLQLREDVNPQKIGLWGGSYGGYLTALGLARNSDIFAAGVDLHGVHDWSYWGKQAPGVWGIVGDEGLRMAFTSSPVASVEFWTSPVLFIHGDDDRNVDFIETTDIVQRLRALNRAHIEILTFPDEVHDFLLHSHFVQAYNATADFFDRFLAK